jgi:hypothetical protein
MTIRPAGLVSARCVGNRSLLETSANGLQVEKYSGTFYQTASVEMSDYPGAVMRGCQVS